MGFKNAMESCSHVLTYLKEGYKFFFDPAFVGSAEVRDNVGTLMSNVIVQNKNINIVFRESSLEIVVCMM